MKFKRLIFLLVGFISLGLGCVGIVLPILPTVPFFLLTVFCFANSSQKLHDWFLGTKLYKKHLESFVQKKGMTAQTKAGIIISVTLLMGIGFTMMFLKGIYVPCIILAVVWVCHLIYFIFGVKTVSAEEAAADAELSEKYANKKVFRIKGAETAQDAKRLESVFADTENMRALVSLKSDTVTVYMNSEPDDELLCELISKAGLSVNR